MVGWGVGALGRGEGPSTRTEMLTSWEAWDADICKKKEKQEAIESSVEQKGNRKRRRSGGEYNNLNIL